MADKIISVCTDAENRITSLSPYDMTGNTDWHCTTVDALGLAMDSELWDDHGACLYKVEDDVAVLRSEEERRADWPEEPDTAQSQEERIAALEDELAAAKILLGVE